MFGGGEGSPGIQYFHLSPGILGAEQSWFPTFIGFLENFRAQLFH